MRIESLNFLSALYNNKGIKYNNTHLAPLKSDIVSFCASANNNVNINSAKKLIAQYQDPAFEINGHYDIPIKDLMNVCKYCGCIIDRSGGKHPNSIKTPCGQTYKISTHDSLDGNPIADPGMVKNITFAIRNLDENYGEIILPPASEAEKQRMENYRETAKKNYEENNNSQNALGQRNYYQEELKKRNIENLSRLESQKEADKAQKAKDSSKLSTEIKQLKNNIDIRKEALEKVRSEYNEFIVDITDMIQVAIDDISDIKMDNEDANKIKSRMTDEIRPLIINKIEAKIKETDETIEAISYSDDDTKETLEKKYALIHSDSEDKSFLEQKQAEKEAFIEELFNAILEQTQDLPVNETLKCLSEMYELTKMIRTKIKETKKYINDNLSGNGKKPIATKLYKTLVSARDEIEGKETKKRNGETENKAGLREQFTKGEITPEELKEKLSSIKEKVSLFDKSWAHDILEISYKVAKSEPEKVLTKEEKEAIKIALHECMEKRAKLERRQHELSKQSTFLNADDCNPDDFDQYAELICTFGRIYNASKIKETEQNLDKDESLYTPETLNMCIRNNEILEQILDNLSELIENINGDIIINFLDNMTEAQLKEAGVDPYDKEEDKQIIRDYERYIKKPHPEDDEIPENTNITDEYPSEIPDDITPLDEFYIPESDAEEVYSMNDGRQETMNADNNVQTPLNNETSEVPAVETAVSPDITQIIKQFTETTINHIARNIATLQMPEVVDDLSKILNPLFTEEEYLKMMNLDTAAYSEFIRNKTASLAQNNEIKQIKRSQTLSVVKDMDMRCPIEAEKIYADPGVKLSGIIKDIVKNNNIGSYRPVMTTINKNYNTYKQPLFEEEIFNIVKEVTKYFKDMNADEISGLQELLSTERCYMNLITDDNSSKGLKAMTIKLLMKDFDSKFGTSYSEKTEEAISEYDLKMLIDEKIKTLDNMDFTDITSSIW